MLLEIRMLNVLLVRSQKEIGDMLLGPARVIFVIKWQRIWLNCVPQLGGSETMPHRVNEVETSRSLFFREWFPSS